MLLVLVVACRALADDHRQDAAAQRNHFGRVPSDAVRVSVGGASLSWISGPSLTGVQVNDSAGNTLITAESIAVDRRRRPCCSTRTTWASFKSFGPPFT